MEQIEQWKGKYFKGIQFNSWVYDDTYPLDKLKEMGYPFTMACFEIAPNEVIAVGMDRDSQTPRDFISENQNDTFTWDASKPSRKIKSMFGEKIVHYAKRVSNMSYETAEKVEEFNYSDLPFYVVNQQNFNRLINNRTVYKIWEQQVSDGQGFSLFSPARQMRTTGKNHFMFQTATTEKMVGISNNDEKVYNIPWELLREEVHKGKKFLVLCGWGDPMSTGVPSGLPQFNYYEIGVEKTIFANLVAKLMSNDPNFFSISKMRNVIGLEGFRFENGQILI